MLPNERDYITGNSGCTIESSPHGFVFILFIYLPYSLFSFIQYAVLLSKDTQNSTHHKNTGCIINHITTLTCMLKHSTIFLPLLQCENHTFTNLHITLQFCELLLSTENYISPSRNVFFQSEADNSDFQKLLL